MTNQDVEESTPQKMVTLAPHLSCLLTEGQLEALHRAALDLLATVGLMIEDQHLRGLLSGLEGVRLRNRRLCLEPWLVEKWLEAYREDMGAQARAPLPSGRILLDAGCCANHIVDPETDEIRPITTTDLIEATQLIDSLHGEGVIGHAPGFPQDVPPALRALVEYRIGSEYTRWGGDFVAPCSIQGLEYIYEMHQVMGQPFGVTLYVVSPLKIIGPSLQSTLHFLDRADHVSVSSMPTMGATAPIHFIGAFVQAIAEVVGGFVVLKLIRPELSVSFSIMSFCFDMKYTTATYGSPEQNLCDLIRIPVSAYYGMRGVSTRSIRTMAKRPGVQAAAEKGASAIVGALAGSRSFMGAGMLSLDEVFSPEQLIIDREIADYAQRVAQGFEFDQERLSLDIIREGAAQGEFLSHDSTAANYRSIYWMPRLFEHPMLQDWRTRGEREVREEARRMVREKLRRYDFELASEKKGELERITQHARERLI
jgi:trimethylamine:corrinoid methyltransferase-like protein